MEKIPEPVTKTDQYLVEIIGLLRSIDSKLTPPTVSIKQPGPAPKKAPKKG